MPTEVLSSSPYDNCLERVRAHLCDLEGGAEPVRDSKLIVLGNGRVGKTQICRRLRGEGFDESVPSTHGIVVDAVRMGDEPVGPILNVWDFGGQDIYHGTHALFSRTRALFLIVWNPGSEATSEYEHEGLPFRNHLLPYWLDYVRHLGGKDSAVILLQSQCDRRADVRPFPPVSEERTAFPYRAITNYSSRTDRNRADLDEVINDGIAYLRERDGVATIGRGRAEVIRRLRQWQKEDVVLPKAERRYRTISMDRFERLCADVGGIQSPQNLLKYLHDSGVVFYEEEHFGRNIILDQSWALDAVYSLFDRRATYRFLKQLKGRFTRSLLAAIAWSEYGEGEQRLFIDLMLACGIAFTVRPANERLGVEAEYVAPDLLPDRASVEADLAERSWIITGPTLVVRFECPFLHLGVIRSLISSVGSEAVSAGVYWRTGVWVREATTGTAAIIEEERLDAARGRIVLRVQGTHREELGGRLARWMSKREDLRDAIPSIEIDKLPLDGPRLRAFLEAPESARKAKRARLESPAHDVLREEERLPDFRRGDRVPKPQPEVFVSYAWGDSTPEGIRRERLVDQLCDSLGRQGLEIIRDKTHAEGGTRISEFMRRLAAGDLVLVVVSERYLLSTNCMTELFQIYRSCGDDPQRFLGRVIPLVLPDARIDKLSDRLAQAQHWKKEFEQLAPAVRDLGAENLGPETVQEYRRIHEFASHVAEILALVKDKLVPREFDRMIADDFREILALIRPLKRPKTKS